MVLALWFSAWERALAGTEALYWHMDKETRAADTCLYGEITVLAEADINELLV